MNSAKLLFSGPHGSSCLNALPNPITEVVPVIERCIHKNKMVLQKDHKEGNPLKELIGTSHDNNNNAGHLDIRAYASLLDACADMKALAECKQIHTRMLRNGIQGHVFLANKLVAVYAKCGSMADARLIFEKLHKQSVFLWNWMIRGYASNGLCEEALGFYSQMQWSGRQPDGITFPCVLKACAGLSALRQGKGIHVRVIRSGFESDVSIGNALVTMYSKCGCLEDACHVFDKMFQRTVVSWTALISGNGMYGNAREALEIFNDMQRAGVRPDHVTFTAVLSACSHGGLVDEGRMYFDSMIADYGITPTVEHCSCMVDLLGRAGRLDEAEDFINRMPLKPDTGVWGALLGACRIHCNVELGERAAENIFALEPENAGYYALLSNIYAMAGRWDGVARVRAMLKDNDVRKPVGCSWIEMENMVHTFLVGDRSHPQSQEIYELLESLAGQMHKAGYIAAIDCVLHDVREEEKEHILCGHSEKLAIAFGLLNTCPGTAIRINKNLRVCEDCHIVTKFISKIAEREIIVRDMNRFHHFKDGLCSCGDYW